MTASEKDPAKSVAPMLRRAFARLDPIFGGACLLTLAFCLYGITWGRVECWDPDQMAMRDLRGAFPLSYEKPPLHTYLNHLLVLGPTNQAERWLPSVAAESVNWNEARLVGSRLLVVALWLAAIYFAYRVSREAFGRSAARIIALLFATSAGFIAYSHFLTCDTPLLFFMVFTLFLALRISVCGSWSAYLLAGCATGLTGATKYNGLAVGISIVLAHVLSQRARHWARLLFDRRLWAGLFMVPVGFLMGNPGALFDSRKFGADYFYNMKVTPYYGGVVTGHGYLQFFERIPEIVGLPGAIVIGGAAIGSLLMLGWRRDLHSRSAIVFVVTTGVFLSYFGAIGSFPRMETRFVLPAVPFLILMTGPFFAAIAEWARLKLLLLVPLLLYNSICCGLVGQRFSRDPRSTAQEWVRQHARPGTVLESGAAAPRWAKLSLLHVVEVDPSHPISEQDKEGRVLDWRMPPAFGRLPLFKKIFAEDRWIQEHVAQYEIEADESLFTRAALIRRNPDFVIVYSWFPIPSPAIRDYYSDMFAGKFPYEIILEVAPGEPPRWIYPRQIDFLHGRITILARRSS